mmetsp:Transcript_17278/g.51839  ORF Transcript_17278/g.51839 Transcript_17278/m.51839 type:complete len:202 (-) Transcript_17278:45-650(-)
MARTATAPRRASLRSAGTTASPRSPESTPSRWPGARCRSATTASTRASAGSPWRTGLPERTWPSTAEWPTSRVVPWTGGSNRRATRPTSAATGTSAASASRALRTAPSSSRSSSRTPCEGPIPGVAEERLQGAVGCGDCGPPRGRSTPEAIAFRTSGHWLHARRDEVVLRASSAKAGSPFQPSGTGVRRDSKKLPRACGVP